MKQNVRNGRMNGRQTRTPNGNYSDTRGRSNPRQVHEKYLTLAREAMASGNKIDAETYFQHAEHYHRVMKEIAPPSPPQNIRRQFVPPHQKPSQAPKQQPKSPVPTKKPAAPTSP